MRFLCLICTERAYEELQPHEAARQLDAYLAFMNDVRESGHYVSCNRLLPAAHAITLRVRDGKLSTTDGPFAETKEQLGGYFVLEARDLNEAIRIAAKIPGARHGCVEVRPIAESVLDPAALHASEVPTPTEMR